MKKLVQYVVVIASMSVGMLVGRYALVPALMSLVPHLKWLLPQSGPSKHDLGDIAVVFVNVGYGLGLSIGVGMTLALMGGLLVGLALARRLKTPAPAQTLTA